MGKRVVNEEEFFTQIQRLRSAIPQFVKDAHDLKKRTGQGPGDCGLLLILDEMEQIVENSKGWMGKRFVSEAEFLPLIQRLRSTLPRARKDAEAALQATGRAGGPTAVEDAQQEAARIIENAQREAQRIIQDAENRSQHRSG
jgi:hypothetical protein